MAAKARHTQEHYFHPHLMTLLQHSRACIRRACYHHNKNWLWFCCSSPDGHRLLSHSQAATLVTSRGSSNIIRISWGFIIYCICEPLFFHFCISKYIGRVHIRENRLGQSCCALVSHTHIPQSQIRTCLLAGFQVLPFKTPQIGKYRRNWLQCTD